MESVPKRTKITHYYHAKHKNIKSQSTYTKWGVWDCPSLGCQSRVSGPRFLDEAMGTDPATCDRCNDDRFDVYWHLYHADYLQWVELGLDLQTSLSVLNERCQRGMLIPN